MKKAIELIDLLSLSMIDERVVNTLNELGLPQPVIDDNYYIDRDITVYGKESKGLDFRFEETGDYVTQGMPSLVNISFYASCGLLFPCEITMEDSYPDIVKKIGKEAPYRNKLLKKSRIWFFTREDGKPYNFSVNFNDLELTTIRGIAIAISKDSNKKNWINLEGE